MCYVNLWKRLNIVVACWDILCGNIVGNKYEWVENKKKRTACIHRWGGQDTQLTESCVNYERTRIDKRGSKILFVQVHVYTDESQHTQMNQLRLTYESIDVSGSKFVCAHRMYTQMRVNTHMWMK